MAGSGAGSSVAHRNRPAKIRRVPLTRIKAVQLGKPHDAATTRMRMDAMLIPTLAPGRSGTGSPVSAERTTVSVASARRMLQLAVGSLIIAGCLSLMLVAGRIPGLAEAIGDPLFFKRCLVVHVDLALVVWFAAFAGTLFALLPATNAERRRFDAGTVIAASGVVLMIAGALVPGAAPVLSNYVPVIADPVYFAGLVLLFGGLLLCFMDGRFLRPTSPAPDLRSPAAALWVPPEASAGFKTAAVAFLAAMLTLVAGWSGTPRSLDDRNYYELVFWGGGHVLQVANVAAMLGVWLWLLAAKLGRPVIRPGTAWILFALLLAPYLFGPLLVREGTISSTYRLGFTRLMQFGIAPVVLVLLGLCVRQVSMAFSEGRLTRRDWRDPRLLGFALSAGMTVAGFVLGSLIRTSNTVIPGHYHASIGAVTMAFMAATYSLLPSLGLRFDPDRLTRLVPAQLACFGVGQVIFALGFGYAGLNGAGRKAYAAEQHVRSAGEYAGLLVMGIGGVIAVVGGLLYLGLVVRAWQARHGARPQELPLSSQPVN